MGAAESTGVVAPLKDQLAAMERKINGLEAGQRALHTWPDVTQWLTVEGVTVRCSDDVRVSVGPVVGRVTSTSAIIMLEVDADADIECHVRASDEHCPEGRPVCALRRRFPANRPANFVVEGLRPCERYTVCFGGVRRADAAERVARFSTYDLYGGGAHVLAVGWDRPESLLAGQASYWPRVAQRLRNPHEPYVDVMLHLGGQVDFRAAFERAWFLLRHSLHPTTADPASPVAEELDIQAQIDDAFRDLYRRQWSRDGVREALMTGSHLMIWSDHDVFENFSQDPRLLGNDRIARILLRAARTTFVEYQRQLWDADAPALSRSIAVHVRARMEHAALAARVEEREAERAEAQAAMEQMTESGVDIAGSQGQFLAKIKELDTEAKMLTRMGRVANAAPPDRSKNTFCHQVGEVGLVCIDMRGHRLEVDGSQAPDKTLLSEGQWETVQGFLEGTQRVHTIIVATELPLVDDAPEKLQALADSSGNTALRSWWGYNHVEQARLLRLLLAWREGGSEHREVVLVSSGLGCSVRSTVRVSDAAFPQFVVGPICDVPREMRLPLSGRLDAEIAFEHEAVLTGGAGYLDLGCKGRGDIVAAFSAEHEGGVNVLLGPVVGRVTCEIARVMIEVGESAPVVCAVRDTLTGEVVQRELEILPARRPFVFELGPLHPERHYEVEFTGVSNAHEARGSFTTPSERGDPTLVFLAAECAPSLQEALRQDAVSAGHLSGRKPDGRLWSVVEDVCARPFGGVGALVHCGGQVNMHAVVDDALLLMQQRWYASLDEQGVAAVEDAVLELCKDAYRTQWGLPAVKATLSSVPNLMLPGHRDLLRGDTLPPDLQLPRPGRKAYPQGIAREDVDAMLQRCLRRVADEYQGQLAEPECAWGRHGETALLALDDGGDDDDDIPWAALERLCAADSPVRSLVLVSRTPVVEMNTRDAALKAEHESHAFLRRRFACRTDELSRLLATVGDWLPLGGRSATIVCGGNHVGLDTLVRDTATGQSLRHVACGPVADRLGGFLGEQEGELDDRFQFQHADLVSQRNFCVLEVVPGAALPTLVAADSVLGSASKAAGRSPPRGHLLLRRQMYCPPEWVLALHRVPEEGEEGVEGSGEEEEEEKEEEGDALRRVLLGEHGAPHVKQLFDKLHGEGGRYDSVAYGRRLAQALRQLYDGFPDEALRELAPPPSTHLAIHVAHLRQSNAGLEPRLAQSAADRARRIESATADFVATCQRTAGQSVTISSGETVLVQDRRRDRREREQESQVGGTLRRARGAKENAAHIERQAQELEAERKDKEALAAAKQAERVEAQAVSRIVRQRTGGRDDSTPLVLSNTRSFQDMCYAILRQGALARSRLALPSPPPPQ